MIAQELELKGDGEEIKLINHINTDDAEKLNWETAQGNGKGFIRGESGEVEGRLIGRIPAEDAAMLEAQFDLDWLAFDRNADKRAFKRLLKRFPYWRCCEGGI